MIDSLSGNITTILKNSIAINIGSLGFSVQVPVSSIYKEKQSVNLFIHMHWNQEKGPSLFGFASQLERSIFLLIISCSGIGPKIGLAVLRDLGAERFIQAVQVDDEKTLSTVAGLGPKKVEQVVVQLKRKIASLIKSGVVVQEKSKIVDWQNVSDVLVSLNYSRTEMARAMKYLNDNYSQASLPFDVLIRHALSFLAKNR
ncbi:Holliday junction branch migration protein RuvA [bacterium]|nr:Holliday junction branch migration protein RuvA [bacterium]